MTAAINTDAQTRFLSLLAAGASLRVPGRSVVTGASAGRTVTTVAVFAARHTESGAMSLNSPIRLLGERSFGAPPGQNPSPEYAVWDADFSRPLADGHRSTVERDVDVVAAVVALNGHISPSAIFFEITKIVVDAVKRCSFWRITHVGVKSGKRFSPFVANLNATSVIPFKRRVLWIVAAADHSRPSIVFLSLCRSANFCRRSLSSFLSLLCCKASARGCSAPLKAVCISNLFAPTFATAQPRRNSACVASFASKHRELSKLQSGQILLSHDAAFAV